MSKDPSPQKKSPLKPNCPVCASFPVDNTVWQKVLTPEEYRVMRQAGTEPAHMGKLTDMTEAGKYCCKGCNLSLFDSGSKFPTRCGWPSFNAPIDPTHIAYTEDTSSSMVRKECHCARCEAHLGHVFDDAPNQPTGQRYCINSISLEFYPSTPKPKHVYPVTKSAEEWRQILTEEEFKVLREEQTEEPDVNAYVKVFDDGHYDCRACGNLLFNSTQKYPATCGWPSFDGHATPKSCEFGFDYHKGFRRQEARCLQCGSHLGHRFYDAITQESGLRYCINSLAVNFVPDRA